MRKRSKNAFAIVVVFFILLLFYFMSMTIVLQQHGYNIKTVSYGDITVTRELSSFLKGSPITTERRTSNKSTVNETAFISRRQNLHTTDYYHNKSFENHMIKSFIDNIDNHTYITVNETNQSSKNKIPMNRTIPETKEYISKLLDENATHLQYLHDQLMNHSKVYFPGSWDGAGIVLEDYKLVFFTQGKVACTVFKQLFRRMLHMKDWMIHKEPHIPHNPKKNGLTYLYNYKIADAITILTSPNWTRAIFVRNPKERTLSAYLDKAAKKHGSYIQHHCCRHHNKRQNVTSDDQNNRNVSNNTQTFNCADHAHHSFLGFLQVIQTQCCCDPHWGLQSNRIDSAFKPYINFVGYFDRIQQDTKRLLQQLTSDYSDLWKQFGATGWGPNGTDAIFSETTRAKHQTSATTKIQQYYNTSVEKLAEEIYYQDYNDPLFHFTQKSMIEWSS